jgi:PEP-CTERM motif
MRSWKRRGMVAVAAVALGLPAGASAMTIHFGRLSSFLIRFSNHDVHYSTYTTTSGIHYTSTGPNCEHPRDTGGSVPEPGAAMLFGLGAAVIAARSRRA